MSKRTNFEKIPKDFYPTTDPNAIPERFISFVKGKRYAEPCCGGGDLVDLLMEVAHCRWESDVVYRGAGSVKDARDITKADLAYCDLIITNPPYTRGVLLQLIDHFISLKPTWLLLPADLMHNKYFGEYMDKCSKIISVGRLKWFKDSKHSSTENFAWYFWPKGSTGECETVFYGRH